MNQSASHLRPAPRIERPRTAIALLLTVVFAVVVALVPPKAQAFPKFAKKENKPCSYCHVKASGGGARNAAGIYYQTHSLSFAGYNPGGSTASAKPVAKKTVGKKPVAKKTGKTSAGKKGAKKPVAKKTSAKKS